MKFPFPVLVGDIGGTNARFALLEEPGAKPSQPQHRGTHEFPSLEAAIADAIPALPAHPKSAIVCAAGPVRGRTVTMTNAKWEIDGAKVAKALGLEQGLLLNDFEAQGLTVPVVQDEWVRQIGDHGRKPDVAAPSSSSAPAPGSAPARCWRSTASISRSRARPVMSTSARPARRRRRSGRTFR